MKAFAILATFLLQLFGNFHIVASSYTYETGVVGSSLSYRYEDKDDRVDSPRPRRGSRRSKGKRSDGKGIGSRGKGDSRKGGQSVPVPFTDWPTTDLTFSPTDFPTQSPTSNPTTDNPSSVPTPAPSDSPTAAPSTPAPSTAKPTPIICSCSPRVYELTFDFSLECEPQNLDLSGGGIADATCLVTGFDDINVTDLVPVAVSAVQIIEIGQGGAPIAVAQEAGDFRDGSAVTYASISFESVVAPRAFQIRALGRNAANEAIVLQWAITFSNSCAFFPAVDLNDSIGWMVFVSHSMAIEYQTFIPFASYTA